jgi:hypothetical protein
MPKKPLRNIRIIRRILRRVSLFNKRDIKRALFQCYYILAQLLKRLTRLLNEFALTIIVSLKAAFLLFKYYLLKALFYKDSIT